MLFPDMLTQTLQLCHEVSWTILFVYLLDGLAHTLEPEVRESFFSFVLFWKFCGLFFFSPLLILLRVSCYEASRKQSSHTQEREEEKKRQAQLLFWKRKKVSSLQFDGRLQWIDIKQANEYKKKYNNNNRYNVDKVENHATQMIMINSKMQSTQKKQTWKCKGKSTLTKNTKQERDRERQKKWISLTTASEKQTATYTQSAQTTTITTTKRSEYLFYL